MDATYLLEADHERVQQMFHRFEDLPKDNLDEMRSLVDRFTRDLSIHCAIEEQVFYPFVRDQLPLLAPEVLSDLEEHRAIKTLLARLEATRAGDDRFRARALVIIETARHHMEDEELKMFPKVRNAFSRPALDDLGDALNHAREHAPTHPHPHAPDTPPANLVTGPVAAMLDRARDKLRELAS